MMTQTPGPATVVSSPAAPQFRIPGPALVPLPGFDGEFGSSIMSSDSRNSVVKFGDTAVILLDTKVSRFTATFACWTGWLGGVGTPPVQSRTRSPTSSE